MRAATVGDCNPGRTATRYRNRSVKGASADAIDPGIFAAASSRQQHAEIAEIVGRLRDLAQVLKADRTGANGGAEMMAVAMGRQEPKDVGVGRRNDAHEAGFLTALETTTCLGISPSA